MAMDREQMVCLFHDSATQFMTYAEADLMAHESENSLLLGILQRIIDKSLVAEEPFYVSVIKGTESVGHGLRSNPHTPLDLSRMPTEAVNCLAETLHARSETLRKVVGESHSACQFADRWVELTGGRIGETMDQGIYELRHVGMPDFAGGRGKVATTADRASVVKLLEGFFRDTKAPPQEWTSRAETIVERDLHRGHITVWEDATGQIVSMAARVRETKNGASISYVYTPPAYRRQGHAGRIVAWLSQRLLDSGKSMCNLYTDLANNTSNGVYQKIGYRLVARSTELAFQPPDITKPDS